MLRAVVSCGPTYNSCFSLSDRIVPADSGLYILQIRRKLNAEPPPLSALLLLQYSIKFILSLSQAAFGPVEAWDSPRSGPVINSIVSVALPRFHAYHSAVSKTNIQVFINITPDSFGYREHLLSPQLVVGRIACPLSLIRGHGTTPSTFNDLGTSAAARNVRPHPIFDFN